MAEEKTNDTFQTIELWPGNHCQEASGESFIYESGDNPHVTLKLIVKTTVGDSSLAHICVWEWLRQNYNDGFGGVSCYGMPVETVRVTRQDNGVWWNAEVEFGWKDPEDGDFGNQGDYGSEGGPNDTSGRRSRKKINDKKEKIPTVTAIDYSFSSATDEETAKFCLNTIQTKTLIPGRDAKTPYVGQINPDPETGEPQGTSVMTPCMNVEISVARPQWWLTSEYEQTILQLTGSINDRYFDCWPMHCALFMGMSCKAEELRYQNEWGEEINDWYWRLVYQFKIKPPVHHAVSWNEDGTYSDAPDNARGITKLGWDFLSVITEDVADKKTGLSRRTPVKLITQQIYPAADFSLLEIPLVDSDFRRSAPEGWMSKNDINRALRERAYGQSNRN